MAKKVRFPLNLREGKQARNLQELRESFSLPEVLGYVANGKLVTWLSDRYENDLAEEISALDHEAPHLEEKICAILGVAYEEDGTTLEEAKIRNEKLEKLKEFTDETHILHGVDWVAFTSEEVSLLLAQNFPLIYLCGDTFSIPLKGENITYIGVNQPTVTLSPSDLPYFQEKHITFQQVLFPNDLDRVPKKRAEERHEPQDSNAPQIDANIHGGNSHHVGKTTQNQAQLPREAWIAATFRICDGNLYHYRGPYSNVEIPPCVTRIKGGAFDRCDQVVEVFVPKSVQIVETSAFTGSRSLCKVTLESRETTLQPNAFLPHTTILRGDSAQPDPSPRHPSELFHIESGILQQYNGNQQKVTIPKGVLRIKEGAFSHRTALVSVVIPDFVRSVESNVFVDCPNLKKIVVQGKGTFFQENSFPPHINVTFHRETK